MPCYYFDLHISREEYLRYYQGAATAVRVVDRDGRGVRFPASALRGHVTPTGISGSFCLVTDENHKLLRLERL
ncbi:DUF2835 domain-containing protein [Thioalkalivibrio sulfidiphilus]|uniref:DUF2835 domain-containing protein n=1 Tax=Thioalkalivibrio sulfidiphilus (strain HL-EbGR7) TaxID=396588 RepID=B8GPB0_THISH|nr:DUF2835 domain-containing protein [Thioalkalivibrio sulfidiphilus]ACL74030.1 conserved hypothetical protein [Thioalkalivibrio sulfidiphilus HL-EbGr7]